jgi:hypothetical protein
MLLLTLQPGILNDSESKDSSSFIVSMPKHEGDYKDLQLLRIVLTDKETKADFGYSAFGNNKKYDFSHGKTKTYIWLKGKKMPLEDLSDFKTEPMSRWSFFTLHFPPILKEIDSHPFQAENLSSTPKRELFDLIIDEDLKLQFTNIVLNDEASVFEIFEDQ